MTENGWEKARKVKYIVLLLSSVICLLTPDT
jgi:hypothetical protein